MGGIFKFIIIGIIIDVVVVWEMIIIVIIEISMIIS